MNLAELFKSYERALPLVVVAKSVLMKSGIDALYNHSSSLIFCWASDAPTSGSAMVKEGTNVW